MIRRLRAPLIATLFAVALAPGQARAQRGVDSQLFKPALDSYGIFTLDRADVSHQWDFGFKIYANYAGNPLRLTMSDENDPTHMVANRNTIMDRQVGLNLGLHLGLTNFL